MSLKTTVAQRPPSLYPFFALFAILQVGDWLITNYALGAHLAVEGNLLFAGGVATPLNTAMTKVAVLIFAWVVMTTLRRRYPLAAFVAIALCDGWMLLVALWNVYNVLFWR